MKFKIKALAAVVALAAAGSAFATDTAAAGGSDLLFYAIDNTKGNSFIYDLGLAGTFNGNTSTISQAIASTAWTSFTSADANWMTDSKWGVVNGSNAAAPNGFVGTTVGAGATVTGQTNSGVNNSVTQVQTLFGNINPALSAGATYYSASTTTGAAADNAFQAFVDSSGKITYLGNLFNAGNVVGATNVAFDKLNTSLGRTGVPTLTTYTPSNGNAFAFDGTTVTYNVPVAAVPEPEAYGLMGAGLLMLGAITRRRRG